MELATGEFIVQNNGDDFSVPERTQVLVDAWRAAGGGPMAFHSALALIDEDGNRLRQTRSLDTLIEDPSPLNIVCNRLYAIGASAAWSREIFDRFGPLKPYTIGEDGVIPMRAALLGWAALCRPGTGLVADRRRVLACGQIQLLGPRSALRVLPDKPQTILGTQRNILEDLALVGDFPDRAGLYPIWPRTS